MKKLFYFLKRKLSRRGVEDSALDQAIVNGLNTIIQSDAIQNWTFTTSSGCDTSVLDTMIFCGLEAKDKYTWSVVDDACIDACNAAYDLCHGGCSAVDWTCGNCCTKECKKGRDECKDACGYLDYTAGYDYKIENIKGVGGLYVVSVIDMQVHSDNPNVFSVTLSLNVPTTTVHCYYKIWADLAAKFEGHMDLVAKNSTGIATGTLTLKCDGDKPGYYLVIDDVDVTIPSNVFDSNTLTQIAKTLGMSVSYLTGGVVDLDDMLLDYANGELSKELTKVLNGVLEDTCLLETTC